MGFVLGLDGAGTSRAGDIRGYFAGYQDAFKAVDYSERACCEMFRGILFGAGLLRGVSVDYSERVCCEVFRGILFGAGYRGV